MSVYKVLYKIMKERCKWCKDLKINAIARYFINIVCDLFIWSLYSAFIASAGATSIFLLWLNFVK